MQRSHLIRLTPVFLLLCFLMAGCRKPGPQSIVRMADLHTTRQLVSGFYQLEAGAWRWTSKQCSVMLKVPAGASEKGGVLTLQGSLPAPALQNGPVTVSASVSGTTFPPQTFSKQGEIIYRADVPAGILNHPNVLAVFTVDKSFQFPGDKRDLGIVASVVSLHAK